jgi:hypothetical protein
MPADQQQAMQRHWSIMQEQVRSVRQMPGIGAKMCSDQMMIGPGAMGPGGTMGCGPMVKG